MGKRTAILMIGLFGLGVGLLIAYDRYFAQKASDTATQSAPNCTSCTLRHRAFADSKKAREERRRMSDDGLTLPKAQPQ